MALTQRLDLRQSQSLVMTPQLQQAIKLLQLSNLELSEYLEGELEKNPMLERDEGEHDQVENEEEEYRGDLEDADAFQSIDFDAVQKAEIEDDARDVDYDNVYSDNSPADGELEQKSSTSFADQYPNTSVGIIDINRVLTESKASLDASKQIEKIQTNVEAKAKDRDESIIGGL